MTAWTRWFLDCLGRAIDGARVTFKAVIDKARFWERIKEVPLNESAALRDQPPAERLRRQAHEFKIREADEVLARHSRSTSYSLALAK